MQGIFPILAYTFAMSISPGPANIMSAGYGVKIGFFKAQSFVLGATIGFIALTLAMGFGLKELATLVPWFMSLLTMTGGLYLIVLGLKLFRSEGEISLSGNGKAGFIKGVLLQWLNPKAWIGAVLGVSLFGSQSLQDLFVFSAIYFVVCWASLSVWSYAGDRIAMLLASKKQEMIFNYFLGLSLVITGIYVLVR